MPGTDFIPNKDAELLGWVAHFMSELSGRLGEFGLVPEDVGPLENVMIAFDGALAIHIQKRAEAKSAVEAKKDARTDLERVVRPLVRRINNHPGMTNDLRAVLGLHVPGQGRRASSVGTDVPSMVLETRPGMVLVHFGTDASNEQLNGKPDWAHGCFIYRKKTGEDEFRMVAYDTASPYADMVSGPAVDVTYRVAYRGTRETDIGPMSPEQTVAAGG